MENKKVLILGAKGFPKVDCYDWEDEGFPNIPDYDVVILNVVSMTSNLKEKYVQSHIKDGLRILLNSKGTLVAIGAPEEKILYNESNYEWCPIPLGIINECGTSFVYKDDTFKEYFLNVKQYPYCFELESPSEKISESEVLKYIISSSVKTRYHMYLAGIINYHIWEKRIHPSITGYGGKTVKYEKVQKSGNFYFLPCPTEITDIEAINFILEKILHVYQKTPSPEWTKSIEVPGLKKIQNSIETNLQKIKHLSEKNNKLRIKEDDLITYRELLYESGFSLQEVVKKVFTLFGYKPKPPKYEEEYTIEFNNKIGIIECKGNKKSIKRDDFRQLLDYHKEYQIDFEGEHKGILVGNAWRLMPIEERNKNSSPIFPDNVIQIAKKNGFALLSTIDLFDGTCKFLEKKLKGKDIVERIFNAKGVVSFDN